MQARFVKPDHVLLPGTRDLSGLQRKLTPMTALLIRELPEDKVVLGFHPFPRQRLKHLALIFYHLAVGPIPVFQIAAQFSLKTNSLLRFSQDPMPMQNRRLKVALAMVAVVLTVDKLIASSIAAWARLQPCCLGQSKPRHSGKLIRPIRSAC